MGLSDYIFTEFQIRFSRPSQEHSLSDVAFFLRYQLEMHDAHLFPIGDNIFAYVVKAVLISSLQIVIFLIINKQSVEI